jgi:hypothetical protein
LLQGRLRGGLLMNITRLVIELEIEIDEEDFNSIRKAHLSQERMVPSIVIRDKKHKSELKKITYTCCCGHEIVIDF